MSLPREFNGAFSAFPSDIISIRVWQGLMAWEYLPDTVWFEQPVIHRFAGMVAHHGPSCALVGHWMKRWFGGTGAPIMGSVHEPSPKFKLKRPLVVPPCSEWVHFECEPRNEPAWFLRLSEFRRLVLLPSNEVYLVFNDHTAQVFPKPGTTARQLFDHIDLLFPMHRHVPPRAGDVTSFSSWSRSRGGYLGYPAIEISEFEITNYDPVAAGVPILDLSGDRSPLTSRVHSAPVLVSSMTI